MTWLPESQKLVCSWLIWTSTSLTQSQPFPSSGKWNLVRTMGLVLFSALLASGTLRTGHTGERWAALLQGALWQPAVCRDGRGAALPSGCVTPAGALSAAAGGMEEPGSARTAPEGRLLCYPRNCSGPWVGLLVSIEIWFWKRSLREAVVLVSNVALQLRVYLQNAPYRIGSSCLCWEAAAEICAARCSLTYTKPKLELDRWSWFFSSPDKPAARNKDNFF